jgi:transposase
MTRRYARAPKGERAVVSEPFRTGSNISIISAVTLDGVQVPMMISGAIDTQVLRCYVEQMLVPELSPGDIVIWDNLHTHNDSEVRRLIEQAGARIEPLPAYSPDLNPKEECISKIKAYLRKVSANTEGKLAAALNRAIELVTPDDVRGWFAHCGYSLS